MSGKYSILFFISIWLLIMISAVAFAYYPAYPDIICPTFNHTSCVDSDIFGINEFCYYGWYPDGADDCRLEGQLCVPAYDPNPEIEACKEDMGVWKKFQIWLYKTVKS